MIQYKLVIFILNYIKKKLINFFIILIKISRKCYFKIPKIHYSID